MPQHLHGRRARFGRFEAEVGLQPGAGGGSVRFRVLVDGRKLFDSGVMRTGDAAKPIRVAVVGAQELTLEADNAGDGITCDMANWADARLVRSAIAARSDPNAGALNLARFAEVIASDPSRKDGARAGRLQEYHAEDVFLYLKDDHVKGDNPLAVYGPNAASHLRRESSYSNCPDLVVNTIYDPVTQEMTGFESQVSHHGGLGGPQNHPFIVRPNALPYDGTPIIGAESVHHLLRRWREQAQGLKPTV